MLSKYLRESSRLTYISTRLCKVYLLIDFESGIQDDDFEFLERNKNMRMGFEVVFSRADKVKAADWMKRALGLSF